MFLISRFFISLIVLVSLVFAFADNSKAGSVRRERLDDSPAPVDILDKEELEKLPSKDLGELMKQLPNVNQGNTQGSPNIRGISPGGDRATKSEIETKAEEHGDSAYRNTLETGFTQEQAARDAGFAAGRRAARLGASPFDAARIAGREVKKRGGKIKDAVDAATYASSEAGGDGFSIGYAIFVVVWDTVASLQYHVRDLHIRYRNSIGDEDRKKLKKELDAKIAELDGWLDYLVEKAGRAARDAGLSPEEEGRAIGATFMDSSTNSTRLTFFETFTGKSLGDRIRGYLGGKGSGLGAQGQGVLTGKAYQTADPGGHWAGSETDKSIDAAGGSAIDKRAVRQKLFPSRNRRAQGGVGSDSQSSAGTANEDAGRLAAMGRLMGGLEETSGTSVQTPYGGNDDDDLLARAREGSKKYEVRPGENRDHNSPVSGGGGESNSGNEAGGSSASSGENQVATSGTSSFVGSWKGDGGCSLSSISISANYTLKGAGPDIPLSVNGSEATGQGAVLFGIANHRLRIRVNFDQMQMEGSNDQGGSCASTFTRIQF